MTRTWQFLRSSITLMFVHYRATCLLVLISSLMNMLYSYFYGTFVLNNIENKTLMVLLPIGLFIASIASGFIGFYLTNFLLIAIGLENRFTIMNNFKTLFYLAFIIFLTTSLPLIFSGYLAGMDNEVNKTLLSFGDIQSIEQLVNLGPIGWMLTFFWEASGVLFNLVLYTSVILILLKNCTLLDAIDKGFDFLKVNFRNSIVLVLIGIGLSLMSNIILSSGLEFRSQVCIAVIETLMTWLSLSFYVEFSRS